MLKFLYDNESDVPADVKQFYAKRDDGKWVLQFDGAGDYQQSKTKLDEFRQNNRDLKKKNDELEEKFKDVDPDKYRELLEIEDDLKKKKLPKDFNLDAEIEKRTAEMRTKHEKELAKAKGENDALTKSLAHLQISEAAVIKATEKGLRPTAAEDLKARAEKTFQLRDGKLVALDKDGEVRYNGTGTPFNMDDFVAETIKSAAHLFEASSGSGAEGGKGTKPGTKPGVNPWKKGSENFTDQARILRENPELAKQYQSAAAAA